MGPRTRLVFKRHTGLSEFGGKAFHGNCAQDAEALLIMLIRNVNFKVFRTPYVGGICWNGSRAPMPAFRGLSSEADGKEDPYAVLDDLTYHQIKSISKALGFHAMGSHEQMVSKLKLHYRLSGLMLPDTILGLFPPPPSHGTSLSKRKEKETLAKLHGLLVSGKVEPYCSQDSLEVRAAMDLAYFVGLKARKGVLSRLLLYYTGQDKFGPEELHGTGPNSGYARVIAEYSENVFKLDKYGRLVRGKIKVHRAAKAKAEALPPKKMRPGSIDEFADDVLPLLSYSDVQKIALKLGIQSNASKDALIPLIIERRKKAVGPDSSSAPPPSSSPSSAPLGEEKEEGTNSLNDIAKRQPRIFAFNRFLKRDFKGPLSTVEGGYRMERVMEVVDHLKTGGTLSRSQMLALVADATALLTALPNVIAVSRPLLADGSRGCLTVVGDTLGDFANLRHLLSAGVAGLPSEGNAFVFNGNMVNHGPNSVSVLSTLLLMKLALPDRVHLLRGVHETTIVNSRGSFEGEVLRLYDQEVLSQLRRLFCALPVAAVVEDSVFVVHGGLGRESGSMTISDLNSGFDRREEPRESGVLSELLWAEPKDDVDGIASNTTGKGGFSFGANITRRFLKKNYLTLMIRSQECAVDGYDQLHVGRCISVFSVPNFDRSSPNYGAVVRFDGRLGLEPRFVQFDKAAASADDQFSHLDKE